MADAGTTPSGKLPVELKGDVNVEFTEASSRQQINSGESVKTLFGKLKKFLTDLKAVAFSGAYSDLSGVPDLTQYALKSKYGDTTINVGRMADTTVGKYSTAEGSGTTASGGFSHAEGYSTTASGECSHAEGYGATASGNDSHAEGYKTIASGSSSHAGGKGTKALHDNEVAYGKYNKSNADTMFSVGDGTSDSDRHNAFEITKTGGKLHDKDIATTDLIPTSLPADGGTAGTARQVTSPSSKVRIYEDNEGGNLELVAPDGVHLMQMDLYNNEGFRIYFHDGSTMYFPVDFNFSTGKFNIDGNSTTVNGHTVNADVPENAVFTDTIPDLSAYAKKSDIPTNVSQLENDSGYLSDRRVIQFIPHNMKYHALNDRILLFSNDDVVERGIYFVNNTPNDITVCALISASAEGPAVQYGYGSNTYPEIQNTGEGRDWYSIESVTTSPTILAMTVPSGKLGYYGLYSNTETAYTTIHDIRCPYFNYF